MRQRSPRPGEFLGGFLVKPEKLTIVTSEQGGAFTSAYSGSDGFVHLMIRALLVRVCVRLPSPNRLGFLLGIAGR